MASISSQPSGALQDSGFKNRAGFRIQDSRFGIWDSGFGIRDSGIQGSGIRGFGDPGIWKIGFRVSGFGIQDSGFGIRDSEIR